MGRIIWSKEIFFCFCLDGSFPKEPSEVRLNLGDPPQAEFFPAIQQFLTICVRHARGRTTAAAIRAPHKITLKQLFHHGKLPVVYITLEKDY
jgi:hypothetical protein